MLQFRSIVTPSALLLLLLLTQLAATEEAQLQIRQDESANASSAQSSASANVASGRSSSPSATSAVTGASQVSSAAESTNPSTAAPSTLVTLTTSSSASAVSVASSSTATNGIRIRSGKTGRSANALGSCSYRRRQRGQLRRNNPSYPSPRHRWGYIAPHWTRVYLHWRPPYAVRLHDNLRPKAWLTPLCRTHVFFSVAYLVALAVVVGFLHSSPVTKSDF